MSTSSLKIPRPWNAVAAQVAAAGAIGRSIWSFALWHGPASWVRTRKGSAKKVVEQLPLMVRDIDGCIVFWNRPAEREYGWSRHQALGTISHHLLSTVFPCPLQEINRELVEAGAWEGELIHTLNDGQRVKVLSRWELQPSTEGPQVIEVNVVRGKITPDSAHLTGSLSRYRDVIWEYRWWFLIPFGLLFALLWGIHSAADHHHMLPLIE